MSVIPKALRAMPTKSTQVMPKDTFAILILPKINPTKMETAKYRIVGPTPEPVKRSNMMIVLRMEKNHALTVIAGSTRNLLSEKV